MDGVRTTPHVTGGCRVDLAPRLETVVIARTNAGKIRDTDMIWMYERGDATMTIETRFNRDSQVFELIWHDADGSERLETFNNESDFRARLTSIASALADQKWRQSGPPSFDPNGWRV